MNDEKINMAVRWSPLLAAFLFWLCGVGPVIWVPFFLGYALAWVQKHAIDNRPGRTDVESDGYKYHKP